MIIVAFPGGAGGHFLGYVVNSLLSQQPPATSAAINFHGLTKHSQSFLNFSFLDSGQSSAEEEQCYIHQIHPRSKLVLGHFRNIDELSAVHQCKIIAVTVDSRDHDLLVARVLREAIDSNFDGIKYQDVRGADWPAVNPGFNKLPRWIQLEIESQLHKMFYFWNSQMQCSTDSVLQLTTHDIFYGNIVDKIAAYLEKPPVKELGALHEHYKQLVSNKYLKNSSSTL